MAMLPPRLADPSDPDDMARWMREVTELLSGQLSFGDPVAWDPIAGVVDPLRPNGVSGHMVGSFVRTEWTANNQVQTLTHNLNVEPKGMTAPTAWDDPLNVGWVIVRCLGQTLVGGGAGGAMLDWHDAQAITANAIDLECHISGHVVNAGSHFITDTWFFPTTI